MPVVYGIRRHARVNGRQRPLPRHVQRFCREEGELVFSVLCEAIYQTPEEILDACEELMTEYPECYLGQHPHPSVLRTRIVQLVELGVATVERLPAGGADDLP